MAACAAEVLPQRDGKFVRTRCDQPGMLVGDTEKPQPGARCFIIIEHILTGRKLSQIIRWIRDCDAQIIGIGTILDRNEQAAGNCVDGHAQGHDLGV